MKKLLFALTMVGISAAAAMAAGNAVKADVPFDFAVAGTELTAGVYTIEEHNQPGLMMIRDSEGRAKAMFRAERLYRDGRSESALLSFTRYGDRYFLSRVWGTGQVGSVLHKSKIERELVASSAAAPANQVVVVVAAAYR